MMSRQFAVLGNSDICRLCMREYPMISPFLDYKVSKLPNDYKAISYGLSGAGYDIKVHSFYRVEPRYQDGVIDPKDTHTQVMKPVEVQETGSGKFIVLDAHDCVKGVSHEYFMIPSDIIAVFLGKSTYARVDIIPHVTPLEPGWHGYLTIEIANLSNYPVRVYLDEGIGQLLFLPVSTSSQYDGYYQFQNEQRPYLSTEKP